MTIDLNHPLTYLSLPPNSSLPLLFTPLLPLYLSIYPPYPLPTTLHMSDTFQLLQRVRPLHFQLRSITKLRRSLNFECSLRLKMKKKKRLQLPATRPNPLLNREKRKMRSFDFSPRKKVHLAFCTFQESYLVFLICYSLK